MPNLTPLARGAVLCLALLVSASPAMAACSGSCLFRLQIPGLRGALADEVGPSNLDFGSILVNTSSDAQSVQVLNSGSAPLTLGTVSTSGPYSAAQNCGSSLPVGGSCSINVTFTPLSMGAQGGILTVPSSGGTNSVSLTGIGLQTQLSVSPTSLNFGTNSAGTPASQTVTLTNNGNEAVTSLHWSLPSDITETDTCGQTLAIGASCSATLTYESSVSETLSDTITVTAQDSRTQLVVTGATQLANSHLLVTDESTSIVYICGINADGSIGTCTSQTVGTAQYKGATVIGQYAYLGGGGAQTYVCAFGTGDVLTNCASTGSGFDEVYQLAVNNGWVYAVNESPNSDSVSYCSMGSGGSLTGCQLTANNGTLSYPTGLAFSGNYAFLVNYGSNAWTRCTVDADGSLSGCVATTNSQFVNAAGLVIVGNYAYIGNAATTGAGILQCAFDGMNFSSCATVGTGLSAPKGLVAYNGVLYVASQNNNSLVSYKIGANGTLTLLNTVTGVTFPQGISMAP